MKKITSDSRHSIYRKHAGDVYFQLQDNWVLDNNEKNTFDHVIQATPTVPMILWSATIRALPQEKIDATDIKSLILYNN